MHITYPMNRANRIRLLRFLLITSIILVLPIIFVILITLPYILNKVNIVFPNINISGDVQEYLDMRENKFPELQNTTMGSEVRTLRQDEDDLEIWYEELEKRWQAIFNVFSELSGDRSKMRSHDANLDDDSNTDHPFLWPKPQTDAIIPIIKTLLDRADSEEEYESKLQELKDLDIWDLRKPPWYRLVLVPSGDSDDSKKTLNQDPNIFEIIKEILRYLLGLTIYENAELVQFKGKILSELKGSEPQKTKWWEDFESLKP